MIGPILALAVSTLYISLTCLIAFWLRLYVTYAIQDHFVRSLYLECIATAELCGACFELIIIADNWGVVMYGIYLFILTIWWSMNWDDASACPYTHLEDVVLGKKSLRVALLLIWAQLIGGFAVFKYIQVLWQLEIVSTHRNKAFANCTTDLQVSVLYGTLVECVATCICRVVSRILGDLNPRHSAIIDSFIGTSLVVAAFNYSGGYFNPALASSLKYGCRGTSFIEHMIVYWFGACLGSLMSLQVYKMSFIQNIVQSLKEKSS